MSYCSPMTVPASVTTNSSGTTTPTSTNTTLASSTNTRTGSAVGDSGHLNRSAPDRKTIHSIPTRPHYSNNNNSNTSSVTSGTNVEHRSSTRNPNSSTMVFGETNNRHQTATMMSSTNSGAQSFLSKLSSKFARR
jgi:hypothetical protein